MSQDAENVKRIISLKQKLEKEIEKLKSELQESQATLEALNSLLLEKGFKRAEIKVSVVPETSKTETIAEPSRSQVQEYETVIPLKTASGELLAILHISEDSLTVLPAEDKNFSVNTPPFTPFLVERVLTKMQEKDGELVKAGEIAPSKVFSYNIVRDGETIREIVIEHVDQERLRELKSSIRWTLEKMYEKMKTQS